MIKERKVVMRDPIADYGKKEMSRSKEGQRGYPSSNNSRNRNHFQRHANVPNPLVQTPVPSRLLLTEKMITPNIN
jgi:hypothetical protein